MTLLTAHDLAVGYAERSVLAGVSLAVAPGELICVLGPNGAGKSTLLRTLAGMQRPLAGGVAVRGRPLAELTPRQLARRIGVVLPERARPGLLKVSALVALGRYPYTGWLGRLGADDLARVAEAIRQVGIEALAERDVGTLSDGERQKAMIARALAQEPTLLILDEPTAFLDLPGRVEVLGLLSRLVHGGGERAALLSTHDLDLALRSADRVWLLDGRGGLVDGAPEDLVLSGAFAAAFAGGTVQYDVESGSFRIPRPSRGTVVLTGEGTAAVWTRRALERRGFQVVAAGEGGAESAVATVELLATGGATSWRSTSWRSTAGGAVTEHASIGELLRALSG